MDNFKIRNPTPSFSHFRRKSHQMLQKDPTSALTSQISTKQFQTSANVLCVPSLLTGNPSIRSISNHMPKGINLDLTKLKTNVGFKLFSSRDVKVRQVYQRDKASRLNSIHNKTDRPLLESGPYIAVLAENKFTKRLVILEDKLKSFYKDKENRTCILPF